MCAAINVLSVQPDTEMPVPFSQPYAFSIEYECLVDALKEDLEWKLIYVGSADADTYDQVLDSVLVGPVVQGSYKFTFEGNAPDASQIPQDDLVGVTVVLLTCSYKGNEFIRVGYFVNVDYADEQLRENPPETPDAGALWRCILAGHPRVTRFPIPFDEELGSQQEDVAMQEDSQDQHRGQHAAWGSPMGMAH